MLERIIDVLRNYLSAPWGYVIVGLATFLENSVGAGVIVPGETLVILGGFYARPGNGDLWLPLVTFVAVLGAVLGDNLGFWIGRRFGRGFVERHGRTLLITPERLERSEAYYAAHGGKTVFLGRFVPVVRSVGFIVAGIGRMPWKRFAAYDLAGAVLWGTLHSVLGYLIGASYERLQTWFDRGGLIVLGALVLLIGGSTFVRRRRKQTGDRRSPAREGREALEARNEREKGP